MNLELTIDGIKFVFRAWKYSNQNLLSIAWVRESSNINESCLIKKVFDLDNMIIEESNELLYKEIDAIYKLVSKYNKMKAFL